MMYFIPWVVLLGFVILAVPIASWLDNRKLQAANAEAGDELADSENLDDDEFAEDEADADEGEEEDDFGSKNEFGGDDFSAFEEVN